MTLPIQFDHHVSGDVAEASAREWLETNGIGGFASSSIVNLNTRRYHGLLVAATKPPAGQPALEVRKTGPSRRELVKRPNS